MANPVQVYGYSSTAADAVPVKLVANAADGSLVTSPSSTSTQKISSTSTAGINGSTTATNVSTQALAANTARQRFFVKNDSTIDVWINFGIPAVATAGGGNVKIAANGGFFEIANTSSAINIISAGANTPVTIWAF